MGKTWDWGKKDVQIPGGRLGGRVLTAEID